MKIEVGIKIKQIKEKIKGTTTRIRIKMKYEQEYNEMDIIYNIK